ncbi:MAG TPA: AMP-binding protein [Candidatus Limnocylindrales bacterium]|nr:AMP-binding protein [Candidatus Limnocylindrales bacterium]
MADGPWFARPDADAPWVADARAVEESRVTALLRRTGHPTLDDLQAAATGDPAWFWGEAIDDLGLSWQRPWDRVLDLGDGAPFARWWRGGAFDHALAALETWTAAGRGDDAALDWEGDDGSARRLSGAELAAAVETAADRLAAHAIGEGTRVGILLPMVPETVVTVLALGRLRAVFTPLFSGYAAPAVAARLRAFEASHLVTADAFLRRGAVVPLAAVARDAVAEAPSVRRVLVVQRLGGDHGSALADPLRDARWDALPTPAQADALPPVTRALGPVDPETPYMVIYTSGTTGAPKGTVHVHGGFPLKAAQDLAHTFDLRAGDALCWVTDLGWMMGPWAISGALLLGARLVLFEGAPDHPDPGRLWRLVERHRVTHLGISPTLIRALLAHGDAHARAAELSSLRVLGSTGEPWNPDPWWWLFDVVGGRRLPIVNYTGGTEIGGGILGATTVRPIRPASFNGPCIGMAATVLDADGAPVADAVGELAITQPWPGMTRSFWGGTPAEDERYLDTYWRRHEQAWVHGDWAVRDRDGFWYLHGRSDDTLKIAGKRVGPAELEAVAVAHPAVLEAAAIGVPDEVKGEVAVLLVVVRRDARAEPEGLGREVADAVVAAMGKPVRPASVVVVPDLPRTRSGKIMRRVARAAWLGLDPGDQSALENPSAVSAIARAADREP